MKRVLILSFSLMFILSFFSFADTPSATSDHEVVFSTSDEITPDWVLEDVAILESVAPVTPTASNGFKRVVLSLIGNYDPVIVEYRYQNTSTSTYGYLRQVEHDYPWLCSCAIFALVLFLAWLFLRTVFSALMR